MKITKIEKKKRLYLLEFDNLKKIYVTEDTIVRFMLTKGKSLTENELVDIETFAQESYAKDLALYYISFQARTENEIQQYLKKHDITEPIIIKVVSHLKEKKWIDDDLFIKSTIESNLNHGDKGPKQIKQKLFQKGITLTRIDKLLENYDFQNVSDRIANKAFKKYYKKYPLNQLKLKIKTFLAQKGFSTEMITISLKKLPLEKDETQEKNLLDKELEKQYRKYSKKYQGYELKQRLIQSLFRKGFGYDDIKSRYKDFFE
ncbi:hypothetical protein HMPREF9318_01347 [Streptococcus urinalis FB127-CNA-2]|uniref:Regulatory protein RecX n=1 Tax=Streptococcus urinalis 2285-97 TaxID=764291 RepID=G5KCS7_9STRE|nr:recombination regulator RecX [Streptococcus urinalis]EHJ55995.1 regulatory protein RecX [Streptococcus urinalis 2285-97]EKS19271.1 hypothetical protein HMPREF9318_01347 [Streptococcus urinalis FB127-CNA-2]VEF31402.1 recombination regulator RecX [Streptococcus urinalis]